MNWFIQKCHGVDWLFIQSMAVFTACLWLLVFVLAVFFYLPVWVFIWLVF